MALTVLTTFSLRTGLEVIENLYGFDLAETSDFPRNYKNYKKNTKKIVISLCAKMGAVGHERIRYRARKPSSC